MISIIILMIKVQFLELGLALPFVFEFHFIDLALNAALHGVTRESLAKLSLEDVA